MPIYLPPLSRRKFLAASLGAVAAGLLRPAFGFEAEPESDSIALLSDTHVAADVATITRDVNMADHLKQVVLEITALKARPAAAIVTGDLALATGQPGDYETFLKLIKPLRENGMPLHLGMGNHDHREHFWTAIEEKADAARPVKDHQVSIIKHRRANLVLLDSLQKTNSTPGFLGDAQLQWLTQTLEAQKAMPALVLVHHNPDDHEGALSDTKALMDVLLPRRQVKALIFGHTHNWNVTKQGDLHLINLPPVSYIFGPKQPSGWVNLELAADGMALTLNCVDPKHPQHNEHHDLKWRTA